MKRPKTPQRFALCLDNAGYPASLERWKLYRLLPDADAAAHKQLRIVDESGEDYLYSEASFKAMSAVARQPAEVTSRSALRVSRM